MAYQALSLHSELDSTQKKIEEVTRKKEELEHRIVELQTPEAVEREAKERLNLKKSGENVVVVVPEKKEVSPKSNLEYFWGKIKNFFTF